MKIRSGFVSNSSSSSFIVAVEGSSKEVALNIKVDLSCYGDVCTTEEEVKKTFLDQWGYKGELDEFILDEYEACLKAVREGKTVIVGSFNSDGEATEQFLCMEGIPETPGVTIIENEPGY